MSFLPNLLSFLRIPLAFLFLIEDPLYRGLVILCALITDILDGFLARLYQLSTKFGAILDPITDKFFVSFLLGIFIYEGHISFTNALSMLSRDIAVLLFSFYLLLTKTYMTYRVQAIWTGKLTTFLQLFVLLLVTYKMAMPSWIFLLFVFLGFGAMVELALRGTEVSAEL